MAGSRRTRPVRGRRSPFVLARELLLFCGAYWLYRLVRGLVVDRPDAAIDNARTVVAAERALHLLPEPALNAWAASHHLVADAASLLYLNGHFVVTTVALALLYLRRPDRYPRVRNAFCVAMGLALALYLLVPTAPPRLTPGAGFSDLVQRRTGVPDATATLYNPYAAIPSMHVAFALLLAAAWAPAVRHRGVAAAWLAYPALVTAGTVLTANHWWLDAVAGAGVAAVGLAVARLASARAWPVPAHRRRPSPTA